MPRVIAFNELVLCPGGQVCIHDGYKLDSHDGMTESYRLIYQPFESIPKISIDIGDGKKLVIQQQPRAERVVQAISLSVNGVVAKFVFDAEYAEWFYVS